LERLLERYGNAPMHPNHYRDLGVRSKTSRANDIQIQTPKLVLFEFMDREFMQRNAK